MHGYLRFRRSPIATTALRLVRHWFSRRPRLRWYFCLFFSQLPHNFFLCFFFIINYTFVFYFHLSYIQDLPRLPVTRPCRGPPCPARKFHTVTSFFFARLLTLHFLLLFIVLPRPRWTFFVAWYFNTNTPSFSFLFFFLLSLFSHAP